MSSISQTVAELGKQFEGTVVTQRERLEALTRDCEVKRAEYETGLKSMANRQSLLQQGEQSLEASRAELEKEKVRMEREFATTNAALANRKADLDGLEKALKRREDALVDREEAVTVAEEVTSACTVLTVRTGHDLGEPQRLRVLVEAAEKDTESQETSLSQRDADLASRFEAVTRRETAVAQLQQDVEKWKASEEAGWKVRKAELSVQEQLVTEASLALQSEQQQLRKTMESFSKEKEVRHCSLTVSLARLPRVMQCIDRSGKPVSHSRSSS
jgi:hypothetical protein